MKISVLGPRGTFSEEAARKFFKTPELLLSGDMEEIFDSVLSGRADYGIVPVENSLEGSVGATLELLQKKRCKNIRRNNPGRTARFNGTTDGRAAGYKRNYFPSACSCTALYCSKLSG